MLRVADDVHAGARRVGPAGLGQPRAVGTRHDDEGGAQLAALGLGQRAQSGVRRRGSASDGVESEGRELRDQTGHFGRGRDAGPQQLVERTAGHLEVQRDAVARLGREHAHRDGEHGPDGDGHEQAQRRGDSGLEPAVPRQVRRGRWSAHDPSVGRGHAPPAQSVSEPDGATPTATTCNREFGATGTLPFTIGACGSCV